ncbi:Uncharacterized protein OBRU01_26718 [Operophtera brumata]|uniref:Uncharacterized protein n=1 Tax=Operophtera brumata TaxID=104452 RepID=A0A0L7K2T1_OPEBR|nr:Uncharacterized protein OBRU01_26718 [Operophtera brumata]
MDLPTLDIKLQIRGLWFDVDHEQDKREYTILINMNRRGGNPSNVLCPRFPRGKNEGCVSCQSLDDNGAIFCGAALTSHRNATCGVAASRVSLWTIMELYSAMPL